MYLSSQSKLTRKNELRYKQDFSYVNISWISSSGGVPGVDGALQIADYRCEPGNSSSDIDDVVLEFEDPVAVDFPFFARILFFID